MYLEFGMAQKYVDDLSRNVKRGLHAKAESGWFPGPTPPVIPSSRRPHRRVKRDSLLPLTIRNRDCNLRV
jgi:DNA invertase Pin-like site-specific DNA recombinase